MFSTTRRSAAISPSDTAICPLYILLLHKICRRPASAEGDRSDKIAPIRLEEPYGGVAFDWLRSIPSEVCLRPLRYAHADIIRIWFFQTSSSGIAVSSGAARDCKRRASDG